MKRQRLNSGDIVAVPITSNAVAVGIILHVSKYFKGAVMLGFYKQLFTSIEDVNIADISGDFIWTPSYTGRREITDGTWKVVANSPQLLAIADIPLLRAAYDLFFKDQILRKLSGDELDNYPTLSVDGGGFLEDRLRRYFGK